MNQVFTKKKLAAALTLAFATGGAAVLAVAPVPGLVAAAQANQFADTTQAVGVTAGVNVPALANVVVTGQTFTITENTGGAIGPAGSGTAGGSLIIAPSGGAKFKAGTKITTSNSGWAFQTSAGTAINNNSTVTLGATDINSDGSVTLFTQTQSNPGAGGSLSLTTINLDTSAVSVGTAVALSLSSSSTATGITKGVSTTIANVSTYGATVARSSTTVSKKAPGAVQTMDQVNITETILGSLYAASTDGATITVELQGGFAWSTKPTLGTASGDNKLDGGSVVTSGDGRNTAGDYTGSSTTKAVYRVESTTDSTQVTVLSLTGGALFVPAGSATGDVTAVVTVNRGSSVLASTTVTLFNIAAKTTTNSFVEASGTTATVDYNTLFTGRTYTTGLAGGVTSTGAAGEADTVKIAESLAGSLAVGGTVTLTLDRGAKWGATDGTAITGDNAAQTNSLNLGQEAVVAATQNVATYTVTAASAGAADTNALTLAKLDLTSATAGDLNVTFGGNAGGSAATIKVADIKDATSTTVGTSTSTVTGGSTITVPDITITENVAGAIPNTDDLLVELPAGYVIQIAGADATDAATLTNNTDVTVTATSSTGAVSSFITDIKAYDVDSAGTVRMLAVNLSAGSSSATGAYTYKISGLKAKAPTSATAGDVTATVGSAPNSATPATLATTKSASGATKASVKVAGIVAATVPAITVTATGANTSQTIAGSVVASGNDQGKLGMIYVAANVPNTGVYLKNSSGAWVSYNAAAPVAYAGPVTLGTTAVEVTKDLNVSTIIGTEIYVGYGLGTTAFGAVAPWNNMLSAGTYSLVYTIK